MDLVVIKYIVRISSKNMATLHLMAPCSSIALAIEETAHSVSAIFSLFPFSLLIHYLDLGYVVLCKHSAV